MTTRLTGCVLEIDANLGGQERTGVFELAKDYGCVSGIIREFIIGPTGEIGARLVGKLDEEFDTDALDGTGKNRRAFVVDAGGGTRSYEITCTLSETPFGDRGHLQMGTTGSQSELTKFDATGAGPKDQGDVFSKFATEATTDSLNPARLHIGHHHDGTYTVDSEPGLYEEPRRVYLPEGPRITESEDTPSTVEVQFTCVLAGSFERALDSVIQEEF
ncbi:hypothetical protein C453_12651 [Haloferax elongans ATCC BAA-1513]|uniref:Uncharacterized protein n=1 Tax=Haloferax elongans ATCC BAA-1513 TaxID=1230453 RepID=M0HIL4_HALEO|nr:hypothetical protein [Haloferax elongans]ELZ84395.1 hypothetical protein C453_12651 [Haloferax elongans ATCC BAA-1513]